MHAFPFLFFDLDGTLADTIGDLALAVNLTLAGLGLPPLDTQLVRGFVGQGAAVLLAQCLRAAGGEGADLDAAVRLFRRQYHEHLTDTTTLYPGVAETLEALSERRMAVITNKPYEHAERLLRHLGIRRHFELVLGHESCLRHKPDAEPALHAMRVLGARKEEVLLVGDAEYDILCARNAGVTCAAALYGFQAPEELRALRADFYLERFADLLAL